MMFHHIPQETGQVLASQQRLTGAAGGKQVHKLPSNAIMCECINITAHCVAYYKADLLPLLVLLCCCLCAECQPPHFAAGVQAPAAAGMAFTWDQCLDATTSLAMFGERCGPNLNKFRWAR
jgi:hypothetical protein